jgi:hypothetical protein
MPRRVPLWLALLPLAAGILVWIVLWRGYAAGFEAELRRILPADSAIAIGGFPYRLEADLGAVRLQHRDAALELDLRADGVRVNRVPWQRDRQVISLGKSQARAALAPLAAAEVIVDSPAAQASLRLAEGRIARLSAVWQAPTIGTRLLPVAVIADRFEAHLRETPSANGGREPANPRLPTQVQLVLGGEGVRFGGGSPLKFALDSELTAAGPIASFARWQADGTVEIRALTLADATGEVARLSATLVPDGDGRLRIAGTIQTVCPASVRAALAGAPPVSEKRTRQPETVAFEGRLPADVVVDARDPARPPAPVRGQQPDCPRLR